MLTCLYNSAFYLTLVVRVFIFFLWAAFTLKLAAFTLTFLGAQYSLVPGAALSWVAAHVSICGVSVRC